MSRNLNKLLNYSLLKISLIPIMLWIISSLVFILLRVAPGDPVDAILGSGADEVSREFLRNKMGLNEPLISQYFSSFIRLKRRFFLTSDPFLLTNNFNPAFATGMRSELIFSESLNKMFSKLSTFSI